MRFRQYSQIMTRLRFPSPGLQPIRETAPVVLRLGNHQAARRCLHVSRLAAFEAARKVAPDAAMESPPDSIWPGFGAHDAPRCLRMAITRAFRFLRFSMRA